MISHALLRRKLSKVSAELRRLREELEVVEHQLVYVTEVAEQAETRSIVSDDPTASHEAREATKDLTATTRDRDAKRARIEMLEAKQDELLDKMTKVT